MASFKIDKKIVDWRVIKPASPVLKKEHIILADVKLPDSAPAVMKTLKAEGKKWYLTVVSWPDDQSKPFALFCHTNCREPKVQTEEAVSALVGLAKGYNIFNDHVDLLLTKVSGDNNVTKLTRTISLLLRHNVPVLDIVQALDKVENIFAGSFLFQIKKHLASYIPDDSAPTGVCSECGSTNLKYEAGCLSCLDCGNSKCG
jgi:hypothetical protein